jgi:2-polyprenyl-3-methyl-5-hydroxy-6-metoxy-1,4-benzoquinol methylase
MNMNLKDTYNKIAKDWHKDHQTDDWWVEGTNAFISLLKPGALVLDVGCAGGFKAKYLIAGGLKVVGIDIAEEFIAIAKREVPVAEFLTLGMEDIKTLPQEFDAIFMQASLLHIPREQAGRVIKDAVTRLKKSGLLYIAVKEVREGKPTEEVKTEKDYGYDYDRFFSYFSLDEIKDMMIGAGLEVVYENRKSFGGTCWIQVIARK